MLNILLEIEGLKGENLSSKILAMLLENDKDIRECFFKVLSDTSPEKFKGIDTEKFKFSVEEQTESGGRMDILIETGTHVIGIENKLWACFADNQPEKYLEYLERKAKENGYKKYSIIILAPIQREQYCLELISDRQIGCQCVFISWEEILKILEGRKDKGVVLVDLLTPYIESQLLLMGHFKNEKSKITQTKEFPNKIQKEFIYACWNKFIDIEPWGKLNRASWYIGYPLFENLEPQNNNIHAWFGLVKDNDEVMFLLVTTFKIKQFDALHKKSINNYKWWGENNNYVYELDIDKVINDEDYFMEIQNALLEFYDEQKNISLAETPLIKD